MRADYVDRFSGDWTGGLKRLVTQGRLVPAGGVSLPDDHHLRRTRDDLDRRVPAHARHLSERMVGSRHAEAGDVHRRSARHGCRIRMRPRPAGTAPAGCRCRPSPTRCEPTRGARVVSLSLKARSAIMLAGHGGDAVTWLSESRRQLGDVVACTGRRQCRRSRRSSTPIPMSADFGKTWTRLLPRSAYTAAGRRSRRSAARWDGRATLPARAERGTRAKPDATFLAQWETQPVRRCLSWPVRGGAGARVRSSDATRAPTCSRVSFSSPDRVGHGFGPRSQEVQDTYAHLDKTIGTLFDVLDAVVGKGSGSPR